MGTFVDTSALLAALNSEDEDYPRAGSALRFLLESNEPLTSTNYVLVETLALLQRRLGMSAVHTFQWDVVPLLDIEWLDSDVHAKALTAFLQASRRRLSFVDCTSFEVMRRRNLTRALALDGDFKEHGFEQIP